MGLWSWRCAAPSATILSRPLARPVTRQLFLEEKAFSAHLGEGRKTCEASDASLLMRGAKGGSLAPVDLGEADDFLAEQLKSNALDATAGGL